jgi:DNA-binding transcriptional regulator LsrR (DeoR family)
MNRHDKERIVRIARLHFIDGLTYQQISRKLNISPAYISKLLKLGRQHGLIEIRIRDDDEIERIHELEQRLISRFALKHAVLTASPVVDSAIEHKKNIAGAASAYLYENLRPGAHLGISWGPTVHETVNALITLKRKALDVQCVQLCGNLASLPIDENGINLVAQVSGVFGGSYHLLSAPAVVDSIRIRDTLLSDSSIRATCDLFNAIEYTISSVGGLEDLDSSTLYRIGYINRDFIEELHEQGAVGDILFRFFTFDGRILKTGLDKRIVGMGLDQYLRVPNKIIVASGLYKVKALHGALKARMVNTLITDVVTAEALLGIER